MPTKRARPPSSVQVDVLLAQNNRCLYCGHQFGDLIIRKFNEWNWLEINWDHFIPYSYLQANPKDNWVASCQLCNRYKSDLIFQDVLEVRQHILERSIVKKHRPLPFWNTDGTAMEENVDLFIPEPPEPINKYDDNGEPIHEDEDSDEFRFTENAKVSRWWTDTGEPVVVHPPTKERFDRLPPKWRE